MIRTDNSPRLLINTPCSALVQALVNFNLMPVSNLKSCHRQPRCVERLYIAYLIFSYCTLQLNFKNLRYLPERNNHC